MGSIYQQILGKILTAFPRNHNEQRQGQTQCTGFCRHIDLHPPVSEGVKKLIFNMIVAAFGSQGLRAPCSRVVGVVSKTPELIITDAYVGVCCTSMKKACEIINSLILRPKNASTPPSRETTYDGIVQPRYDLYPNSGLACMRNIYHAFNPPAEVVKSCMRYAGALLGSS